MNVTFNYGSRMKKYLTHNRK